MRDRETSFLGRLDDEHSYSVRGTELAVNASSGRSTPCWLGDSLSHVDIAAACTLRFTMEGHPGLFDAARWPTLAAHTAGCEALQDFRAVSQPVTVRLSEVGDDHTVNRPERIL